MAIDMAEIPLREGRSGSFAGSVRLSGADPEQGGRAGRTVLNQLQFRKEWNAHRLQIQRTQICTCSLDNLPCACMLAFFMIVMNMCPEALTGMANLAYNLEDFNT